MADPYSVLGVARNADAETIKKAYRKLARENHPDISEHSDAEDRFKQINGAYEVLSDPERRRRYDMFGDDGSRAAGGAGAGAGGPFGGAGGFGDLGDLMETMFGQGFGGQRRSRGPRSVAQRGADVETTVRLSMRDAVFGVDKDVETYMPAACEPCEASGLEPGTGRARCAACEGAGEIRSMQRSIFGTMVTARPCNRCAGSGQVAESPCRTCAGEGRVVRASVVSVEIPGGVEHGTTLRVRGRGESGVRGGESGDLYVHIGVEPDSVFRRDGNDLLCNVTIPMVHAILGSSIVVPTLDGEQEQISVEPGTQPGSVVRVRGKGVPHLGGRGRGDLVIGIDVEVPRKLPGDQKELIQRLAELRDELPVEGEHKPRKRGLRDVLRGS